MIDDPTDVKPALDRIEASMLGGRDSEPLDSIPASESLHPDLIPTELGEASLTRISHSKDEALEGRIKQGYSGLELLAWVERTYKCDRTDALIHVNRVANEAATSFRSMFNEDHVLLMAADLYNKAATSGRTKEAASMLQVLMALVSKSPSRVSASSAVRILEYVPENMSIPENSEKKDGET